MCITIHIWETFGRIIGRVQQLFNSRVPSLMKTAMYPTLSHFCSVWVDSARLVGEHRGLEDEA